jgi:hypothetical protein
VHGLRAKKEAMTRKIYLNQLSLRQQANHYHLTMRAGDAKIETETDLNLGHITSAFSHAVKALLAQLNYGGVYNQQTEFRTGSIVLQQWRIDNLYSHPEARWQMVMESGPYKYTVNMDRDLEHIIMAFSAAVKFFAQKHKQIVLTDEEAVNIDRAAEAGWQ